MDEQKGLLPIEGSVLSKKVQGPDVELLSDNESILCTHTNAIVKTVVTNRRIYIAKRSQADSTRTTSDEIVDLSEVYYTHTTLIEEVVESRYGLIIAGIIGFVVSLCLILLKGDIATFGYFVAVVSFILFIAGLALRTPEKTPPTCSIIIKLKNGKSLTLNYAGSEFKQIQQSQKDIMLAVEAIKNK